MAFDEYLDHTGDVKFHYVNVKSLTGKTADVSDQVVTIEVYEDIFVPFRTMNVTLKESNDFLNLFPFIGEEFVEIKLETPTTGKFIEGLFYVYRVSDRIQTRDKEVVYALKCISYEWLADINTKISKSFKGKCSDIAKELIQDGLATSKNVYLTETTNKTAFTGGFWSPIKCLNHMAKIAVGKNDSPTFLFFENKDGFVFECINDLLVNEPFQQFVKDNMTRQPEDDTGFTRRNPEEEYKRILSMTTPDTGDFMDNMMNGMYKTTLWSHDGTKKYGIEENIYEIDKDDSQNLLNENKGYTENTPAVKNSKFMMVPKKMFLYNDIDNTTNDMHHQKRVAFFNNLMKFKVNLLVFGRTDYTIGQVMELWIPKMNQTLEDGDPDKDNEDEVLSGKYLLIALAHHFTREGHRCSMELVKNSMKKKVQYNVNKSILWLC